MKLVLYSYSKGIISSRPIADSCRANVVFIALSTYSQPHFTITIAESITASTEPITELFRNMVLVCDEMELIGKKKFSKAGRRGRASPPVNYLPGERPARNGSGPLILRGS